MFLWNLTASSHKGERGNKQSFNSVCQMFIIMIIIIIKMISLLMIYMVPHACSCTCVLVTLAQMQYSFYISPFMCISWMQKLIGLNIPLASKGETSTPTCIHLYVKTTCA